MDSGYQPNLFHDIEALKMEPTEQRIARRKNQFKQVCQQAYELFLIKNAKYRDGIAHTGVLGAAIEVFGAAMRLTILVLKSPVHGRDNRQDLVNVAKDIHNYANILLMMMEDDNWEGDL